MASARRNFPGLVPSDRVELREKRRCPNSPTFSEVIKYAGCRNEKEMDVHQNMAEG
jgi:hypothetical protein